MKISTTQNVLNSLRFLPPRALLGLLGAVLVACAASHYPDPDRDLPGAASAILSRAIAYPTVNPPGGEHAVARLYARVLEHEGIPARVLPVPNHPGRSAVWARLPGTGAKRPIVLLSHLDVVPADEASWETGPFEGAIRDGHVVGRGALDAKGVGVVQLLTLVALADKAPLERDVIFLATPDEETGGRLGAGWITREHPELLHNAEFLLTEGGGILARPGSAPMWGVTVVEKSPCWLRVVARGAPGHSSTAPPESPVTHLVAALDRVRRFQTEVRVIPEVARMFAALAPFASAEDRAGYGDLALAFETDPGFRRRFLTDAGRAALVRNTVAITMLEGSPRTNVIPATATAHLDARLLPGDTCAELARAIDTKMGNPRISLEILLAFDTRSSPMETDLFRAIERVAEKVDPGAHVVPRVISGFTDAHYFRDLGIVSYGFVPRWLAPGESRRVHGPNERVSVENLERGVDTLVQILEAL